MKFFKEIKKAAALTAIMILVCGFLYPLAMTVFSRLLFPHQAGGSLLMVDGRIVGSEIVGQNFVEDRFLKGRPSAIGYNTYNMNDRQSGAYRGINSGSANYAPSNPALVKRVKDDLSVFLHNNPGISIHDIPTDLMTSSGSGLDPHISPAAAQAQLPALAKATGLSMEYLESTIKKHTGKKILGVFGEQTVNVLKVNLDIAAEITRLEPGAVELGRQP